MTKACVGFSYDSLLKDCWLSAAPWSKVPPTGGFHDSKMACQKKGVNGGFIVFIKFFNTLTCDVAQHNMLFSVCLLFVLNSPLV